MTVLRLKLKIKFAPTQPGFHFPARWSCRAAYLLLFELRLLCSCLWCTVEEWSDRDRKRPEEAWWAWSFSRSEDLRAYSRSFLEVSARSMLSWTFGFGSRITAVWEQLDRGSLESFLSKDWINFDHPSRPACHLLSAQTNVSSWSEWLGNEEGWGRSFWFRLFSRDWC